MEDVLRDFMGRPFGILRYESNGDIAAVDYHSRHVLGYYRKQYDHTTDFSGKVLWRGNVVVAFFFIKK